MSGRKIGHITPSPTREAQRMLGPVAGLLIEAKEKFADLSQQAGTTAITGLENSVSEIRKQLSEYRKDAPRRKVLNAAFDAEVTLARVNRLVSNLSPAARFDEIVGEIRQTISSGNLAAIPAVQDHAMELIRQTNSLVAMQREISVSMACLKEYLTPPNTASTHSPMGGGGGTEVNLKAALTAKQKQSVSISVGEEAQEAEKLIAEDTALGGFDQRMHGSLLSKAVKCADALEFEKASNCIAQARALRGEALLKAARIRELIRERLLTAEHLAKRLIELNYDQPEMYYDAAAGSDAEAPLVIYASNPSGTANVRITIAIDGKLSIDIDDVGEGEEATCVALLKGFSESLSAIDQRFTIDDYGRAAALKPKSSKLKLSERVRERQDIS